VDCTCKFEKHKPSFLSEDYEQTFHNKTLQSIIKMLQCSNQSGKDRHVMRKRVLRRAILFFRVR